jgi:homoserine dehydrogenase
MRIALLGFGAVGRGLTEILRDKSAWLRQRYGFEASIVGVATRTRGSLFHPDGLSPDDALAAYQAGSLDHYPDQPGLVRGLDALALSAQDAVEVIVEATPTNFQTGLPAADHCLTALRAGKHVVLANKGPIALHYAAITQAARAAGRLVRFEATVMAGTPSVRLAQQALAGCHIAEARGILNGTTNYMLTHMEQGQSYDDALAQAQALGYAEADPTADVDGWDAAAKAVIVSAALFGTPLGMEQINVTGIRHLTLRDIEEARAVQERWRLIAHITPTGGTVAPMRLPISRPLAHVQGATNAITYTTDELGDVTLIGAGAGQRVTGFGVLSDLLEIDRVARGFASADAILVPPP